MTRKSGFAIMVKLSAREPRKAGPSGQANLENDTEKRETRHQAEVRRSFGRRGARRPDGTVRFEELNAVKGAKSRRLWRAEGGGAAGTEKD